MCGWHISQPQKISRIFVEMCKTEKYLKRRSAYWMCILADDLVTFSHIWMHHKNNEFHFCDVKNLIRNQVHDYLQLICDWY